MVNDKAWLLRQKLASSGQLAQHWLSQNQGIRVLYVSESLARGLCHYQGFDLAIEGQRLHSAQAITPLLRPPHSALLFCQYWHDLMLALLPNQTPCPELLSRYGQQLAFLQAGQPWQALWPRIEQDLLASAGLMPDFLRTGQGQAIAADGHYQLQSGVLETAEPRAGYLGAELLAWQQQDAWPLAAWLAIIRPHFAQYLPAGLLQYRHFLETL